MQKINFVVRRTVYFLTEADEIDGEEIKYDVVICKYFSEPESDGAYLIASEYVKLVANTRDGQNQVAVPAKYIEYLDDWLENRLEEFVEEIDPNGLVYVDFGDDDHSNDRIQLSSSSSLTTTETYIILALYSGCVKYNSFAAVVQYHAEETIKNYNGFSSAIVGAVLDRSIYERALRADMTTEDTCVNGLFCAYHDLERSMVEG